jgi:hypothetical protein
VDTYIPEGEVSSSRQKREEKRRGREKLLTDFLCMLIPTRTTLLSDAGQRYTTGIPYRVSMRSDNGPDKPAADELDPFPSPWAL